MTMKHENVVSNEFTGSLRNGYDYGNGHKSMMIGWMTKNNRADRAARFSALHILNVVCLTSTQNFRNWGSDKNASPQQ